MAELYPVSQLKERYGIGKQAEINRRKHLEIKPTKIKGSYYITEQELNQLDALDQWLKEGNKMKDFDESLPVDYTGGCTRPDPLDVTQPDYQEATLIENEEPETISLDWYELLKELADNLQPARCAEGTVALRATSPIQNWRDLEEACEKGWLLTTKQVQELAGAKPKGSQWQRGAFIFTRAGKIGNQGAWLVEKKV